MAPTGTVMAASWYWYWCTRTVGPSSARAVVGVASTTPTTTAAHAARHDLVSSSRIRLLRAHHRGEHVLDQDRVGLDVLVEVHDVRRLLAGAGLQVALLE